MIKHMSGKFRHYERHASLPAPAEEVFAYVDDHAHFSSHMNKASWMLGGGKMETHSDAGHGQKVGSHIHMWGTVFGVDVSLDEVVTVHEPPRRKVWRTVGSPKLIVISTYQMGVEVKPEKRHSELTVSIDYELPKSPRTRWLGYFMGDMYAKWCVDQMINSTQKHFNVTTQVTR
jgi:hypothetical protein